MWIFPIRPVWKDGALTADQCNKHTELRGRLNHDVHWIQPQPCVTAAHIVLQSI